MTIRENLLDEIAACCRATGMAETTFGRKAVNDGKFVARLRAGKGVTLATVEAARRFIAENTPAAPAPRTTPGSSPGGRLGGEAA